jgi:hypothetical protein
MMSRSRMKYIFYVPKTLPTGRVLVHNLVCHDANTMPGTYGFRAWLDIPRHDYVICSCGWAGNIGRHYHEAPPREI